MTDYLLRLLVLVPLVGAMAWGSLWLWKRVERGRPFERGARRAEILEVLPVGADARLAVVGFSGRALLVGVSRGRFTLIAEEASNGDA